MIRNHVSSANTSSVETATLTVFFGDSTGYGSANFTDKLIACTVFENNSIITKVFDVEPNIDFNVENVIVGSIVSIYTFAQYNGRTFLGSNLETCLGSFIANSAANDFSCIFNTPPKYPINVDGTDLPYSLYVYCYD